MRADVLAHRTAAERAVQDDGHVDLNMACAIAAGCFALLDAWEQLDEPQRRAVQAACLYYVHQDDEEDDFSSVVGFDDDAEVLNHVAALLKRPELSVS